MLQYLQIENIATIYKAEIGFDRGLNILTGETGAGKSILIDSINAVSGAKTSRELIRTDAPSAYVRALFCDVGPAVAQALAEAGLPAEEDGSLLLQRRLYRDGRNDCFVNGVPVTVGMLKNVAMRLINIHGQRDSQTLLDSARHIEFLDAFAEDGAQKADYEASFAALKEVAASIRALSMDEAYKARRLDLLQFQIKELRNADVQEGEIAALKHKKAILNNSLKVREALSKALNALIGDGDAPGADALLSAAAGEIYAVSDVAKGLSAVADSVDGAKDTVLDAASVLDDVLQQLAANEGNLDEIEERLDLLYRLSRKYGATEKEMLAFLAEAETELENITFAEEKTAKLTEEYEALLAETEKKAAVLSKCRKKAAKALSAAIENELSFLDMPNARFVVNVEPADMTENGADAVEFLISANPGEAPKALGKVASGGELSRVMLAVKNVLQEQHSASSLIFDEIDTGVSGSAAGKIALKLSALSRRVQVLCITHSAQIAAFADAHKFLIKHVENDKTFTEILSLDEPARARELARITYGENCTPKQLESAAEMIRKAQEEKRKMTV
ncbi:MAG: DNA repair protein RecN [Clostridia bacterium]|nr:DNA repair protein RecN [Clostridia bacterium]